LVVSSNLRGVAANQRRISLHSKWLHFIPPALAGFECPLTHNIMVVGFLAFVSYHLLCAVLDDREVTLDTIVGAICLYLLAGLLWTYLYATIILTSPSAFQLAITVDPPIASPFGKGGFQQLVYLSFVTMTTLGYGDITPVSAPAQTASYLQAVFGQFFLAVLVARLVTLYIAEVTARRQDDA
jgi:hypothetical protein